MGGVHAFKVLFQTDISVVSKQFYALPSDACLPLSTIHLLPLCPELPFRTTQLLRQNPWLSHGNT